MAVCGQLEVTHHGGVATGFGHLSPVRREELKCLDLVLVEIQGPQPGLVATEGLEWVLHGYSLTQLKGGR